VSRLLSTAAALLLALGFCTQAAAEPPEYDDDEVPVRLSLPTESDREAWRKPGFRLSLGGVYGYLEGIDGAPDGDLWGVLLRVGARLDERWSLLGSFQYLSASADAGLAGLRFAGTIDPTWHITDSLELAMGLGFGGIVEGRTDRDDPAPAQRSSLNSPYTFPSADPPLQRCNGVGVAGLIRLGWNLVLGSRSSTGLAVEVGGQWTGCVDDTNRVEPDTATPIVRRQWWPHVSGTAVWVVTWR
jgi:hypothetical protein